MFRRTFKEAPSARSLIQNLCPTLTSCLERSERVEQAGDQVAVIDRQLPKEKVGLFSPCDRIALFIHRF